MEPNESTQHITGQRISFSGDYRAACCAAVKQFTENQLFPNCSEHGETEWSWIPPFVQSDFGTDVMIGHWKHVKSQRGHAAIAQGDGLGISVSESIGIGEKVIPSTGTLFLESSKPGVPPYPEILLQAVIIVPGNKTSDGQLIEAVTSAWFEILNQLERDPTFLYKFSHFYRKFEELMAGRR